jgi:hypothetical protein
MFVMISMYMCKMCIFSELGFEKSKTRGWQKQFSLAGRSLVSGEISSSLVGLVGDHLSFNPVMVGFVGKPMHQVGLEGDHFISNGWFRWETN